MSTLQQLLDAGHHGVNLTTNATTANGNAIKAGDIVKAADGEYYRAIRDRTSSTAVAWNNYATDHSAGLAAVAAGNSDWNNNIPVSIYNNGRMFIGKRWLQCYRTRGCRRLNLIQYCEWMGCCH